MNWFALYTKPRNEKKVAEQLEKLGIEVYCPLVAVVKQWSDRKKTIQQPLFNSYVFVRLEEKERDKVFQVPGVVRYLFWLGKPAIVRDDEVKNIQELLLESYKEVVVTGLVPGSKVTLDEGVFKGQMATYIEKKGNKTILVLDSLGMTLILER